MPLAVQPRSRKAPSVDEILNLSAQKTTVKGRRAGSNAGPAAAGLGPNVRGEIADDVVLQELSALHKQKAGSWHVVGLDTTLDAAILAADEHTAIGKLKNKREEVDPNLDEDDELQRMREEIAVLDRLAANMRGGIVEGRASGPPQFPLAPKAALLHAGGNNYCGGIQGGDASSHSLRDAAISPMGGGSQREAFSYVPSPPVPGGFLGSSSGSKSWEQEREEERSKAQEQRRIYKAELDEQLRQKKTSASHGRRAGPDSLRSSSDSTSLSMGGGGERDEGKEERQRLYRMQLDAQVQAKGGVKTCSKSVDSSRDAVGGGSGPRPAPPPPMPLSPALSQAATKVASMHWGERDIQRWYDQEAKKIEYKKDLEQQMIEKKNRDGARTLTGVAHTNTAAQWPASTPRMPTSYHQASLSSFTTHHSPPGYAQQLASQHASSQQASQLHQHSQQNQHLQQDGHLQQEALQLHEQHAAAQPNNHYQLYQPLVVPHVLNTHTHTHTHTLPPPPHHMPSLPPNDAHKHTNVSAAAGYHVGGLEGWEGNLRHGSELRHASDATPRHASDSRRQTEPSDYGHASHAHASHSPTGSRRGMTHASGLATGRPLYVPQEDYEQVLARLQHLEAQLEAHQSEAKTVAKASSKVSSSSTTARRGRASEQLPLDTNTRASSRSKARVPKAGRRSGKA